MGLVSLNMNLDYIRTFVVTAQSKSMLEASKKMNVTPSYVSRHIESLENKLNTKLVIVGSKSQDLQLTESGEYFYEKYEKIYNEILLTEKEFMQTRQIDNCKITIGVSYDLENVLVKSKIIEFANKYPNICIKIVNGDTTSLVRSLTQFSLDMIIDKNLPDYDLKSQEIKTIKLFNSNYSLVFNRDIYNKNNIDIRTSSLIVPTRDTQERKLFDDYFASMNIKPNIKYELKNDNIISYVKDGLGVGIVLKELIKDEKLDYIDLNITSNICISYIKGKLTPSVKEFLKLFES